MDVTRMTRLAHWKLYTLAENYPEYITFKGGQMPGDPR